MTSVISFARCRIAVPYRFVLAIMLAGLADWLFFGWNAGISVAVFFLALVACAIVANPVHASARQFYLACIVLGLSLLPIVEGLNGVSFLLGLSGSLFFILVMSGAWPRARHATGRLLLRLAVGTPLRLIADLLDDNERARRSGRRRINARSSLGWFFTLGLGLLFVWLLSYANPLISGFLSGIGGLKLFPANVYRGLHWVGYLSVAWIFVGFSVWRCRKLWQPAATPVGRVSNPEFGKRWFSSILLSKSFLVRSLVLFNLIFAVQTILDAVYLWGGVALPDGMTYASYAHRGSYPLLAAALLAAAFILLAVRKGSEGEKSRTVRALIYLWVAQNVILVFSAILRLDLYVQVYSLTMMRVAAFIWMGLVVVGFFLIAIRVALRRSNGWLVAVNSCVAIAVLYVCCFVNFPSVITGYNIDRAKVGSVAQCDGCFGLDFNYARSLGMQAYPAIDRFLKAVPARIETCWEDKLNAASGATAVTGMESDPDKAETPETGRPPQLNTQCERMENAYVWQLEIRNEAVARHLSKDRGWRNWSYSDKRALDYLKRNAILERVSFDALR